MKKKGFTLIELLVVIAIIFTLAALAIFALSPARGRARDSKRVANLDAIRGALEMYRDKNGEYPETGGQSILSDGSCEPVACGSTAEVNNWSNLVDKIETNNFLTVMPNEPILGKTYQEDADTKKYVYYYTATNSNYKMMARLEENPEVMQNDGGSLTNFYEVYSIGAVSWADCPPVTEEKLLISEVYYDVAYNKGPTVCESYNPVDSDPAGQNDRCEGQWEWVELYNPTEGTKNLKGWKIQDQGYTAIIISDPPNALIGPHEFKVVAYSVSNVKNKWPSLDSVDLAMTNFPFYLMNNERGWLRLFAPTSDDPVDEMSWGKELVGQPQIFDPDKDDILEGHSYGRQPACADTNSPSNFIDQTVPNPGS